MAKVRDILLLPLGETPYTTVKGALLRRLFAHAHRRIQQLLNTEKLGDRCPTQFLRHLQPLLGDTADSLDTVILHELFLQRLPTNVRLTLISAH